MTVNSLTTQIMAKWRIFLLALLLPPLGLGQATANAPQFCNEFAQCVADAIIETTDVIFSDEQVRIRNSAPEISKILISKLNEALARYP